MNGIVSNAKEVEQINESEMLLHPRTKKPTAVFWMIVVLVFIIVYYFTAATNSKPESSHNVNPKLLVNAPSDVGHQFQQEFPGQNAQVVDAVGRPVVGIPQIPNVGGIGDNNVQRPVVAQFPNVGGIGDNNVQRPVVAQFPNVGGIGDNNVQRPVVAQVPNVGGIGDNNVQRPVAQFPNVGGIGVNNVQRPVVAQYPNGGIGDNNVQRPVVAQYPNVGGIGEHAFERSIVAQVPNVGGIGNNADVRPAAGVAQAQNVNQQPVQQNIPAVQPVLKSIDRLGGFANPRPLHREPPKLRKDIEDKILNLGHGLNLRKDINQDYIDAAINNMDPEHDIIIPNFNPNRLVEHKKMEDYAFVRRPDPKSFPVGINLSPSITTCQRPVVVVLVTSILKEIGLRATIRRTWGKKQNMDDPAKLDGDWKVFFLMGRPQNVTDNKAIIKEGQVNNDIIQGDFIDMVEEETRKVIMGLTWIVEQMALQYRCQPSHVLRAEADMYINMPSIFKWLKSQSQTDLYVGHIVRRDYPNRDVESPYHIPKDDYPRSTLPDYANSPVYLMSYDNVRKFVGAISAVTPIAMDGVYIGLLAENARAKPTNDDHFVLMKRPSNPCLFKHMYFIFQVSSSELIHIYNVLERHIKDRECSRTDF